MGLVVVVLVGSGNARRSESDGEKEIFFYDAIIFVTLGKLSAVGEWGMADDATSFVTTSFNFVPFLYFSACILQAACFAMTMMKSYS